jgi:Ca-activated chloride channel family protein
LDYDALKIFLEILDTTLIPFPGTNISRAIDVSIKAFIDKERKGKFIILLTDGEDHSGKALEAAKRAKEEGIVIYTIGIGTEKGSIIPVKNERGEVIDFKKDKEGKVVTSKLDEELLKKIALETGGKYHYSESGNLALDKILKDMDEQEKKELGFTKVSQFEEKINYTLLPAFLLLCYSFISSSIRREK